MYFMECLDCFLIANPHHSTLYCNWFLVCFLCHSPKKWEQTIPLIPGLIFDDSPSSPYWIGYKYVCMNYCSINLRQSCVAANAECNLGWCFLYLSFGWLQSAFVFHTCTVDWRLQETALCPCGPARTSPHGHNKQSLYVQTLMTKFTKMTLADSWTWKECGLDNLIIVFCCIYALH